MESMRGYDKNGVLNEILIVLKPSEAQEFVSGHEDREDLVIQMRTVVREALERVKDEEENWEQDPVNPYGEP